VWDAELAAVAQRHADQCRFKHDCSECRAVERFPVGQNLYMSYATDGDLGGGWKEAVYGWFNEVKSFPNSYIDPFTFKHSTGHYSQMMWATTTHVGCGYRFFKEGNWYKKLYICNYG
ncbi:CAP domain, partial [Trinorchestia longiramus]